MYTYAFKQKHIINYFFFFISYYENVQIQNCQINCVLYIENPLGKRNYVMEHASLYPLNTFRFEIQPLFSIATFPLILTLCQNELTLLLYQDAHSHRDVNPKNGHMSRNLNLRPAYIYLCETHSKNIDSQAYSFRYATLTSSFYSFSGKFRRDENIQIISDIMYAWLLSEVRNHFNFNWIKWIRHLKWISTCSTIGNFSMSITTLLNHSEIRVP